ncbi:transglycosylase domain-containing protein [Glycomyces sp. TRM65418]|uniref:transglycosylase domain-containing protein n=1 Tax=Glycomyces sp. TRM65418 TaxID=2867006 RepID=UPI001CE5FAE6|nr:transglycosylase domain-containing protein [Glycomyces sp. TRM65418]MCC3764114.1 transglycosylase domain-containing protein [Glycomyces sp. TRM65418]QZD53802.1 transglycosylase domain-containing protein [Glycomyces sp. TRM65418]
MSDYGYRPAPPPEDGRPQGRGTGQPGGRAYGSAPGGSGAGSNDPDYGWGGPSPQRPGGQGQSPQAPGPRRQPYGTPASGSASVGRGQVPPGRGSAPVGRPTGSASVGSASVGGPGRASVGGPGRASVGSASVGSASVGSASVGTARPVDVDGDGPGERTGRASVTGTRRAGKGPLNKDDLEESAKKKKRKRLGRKMLAAMIALGVLFIAGITVVGTYFFQNTPPLEGVLRAGESSAFYYADGTTQAGAFGDTLRLQADPDEIPEEVKEALVALEDRKFYEHSGVNFARTASALVNNLTGGETQGASTITQQYAGMYMDARDQISYDRKAREAALAFKMEQEYSKDEIITAYLNMAYFGRGAYGIEAAAKNYFDVPLQDLDYGQAAFIVMQVKSPNGYYDSYYQDAYNEEAALARWDHAMQSLVETGELTQAERDEYTFPETVQEFNASGSWGGNTDLGFIINELDGYVYDELQERYGITKEMLKGSEDEPNSGGYKIDLTIDPVIQNSLRITGSRGGLAVEKNENGEPIDADGNVVQDPSQAEKILTEEGYAQFENSNEDAALFEYEEYMMTAMVAIDPKTGEILGYYGGDNGFGVDKAGAESPHPPSSTFKMVTAATAMANGDSPDSWFNASSPRQFESLTNDDGSCIGSGTYPNCTLRNGSQESKVEMTLTDAVRDSKNTPMYAISEHYGADKILDIADQMGLSVMNQARTIQDDTGEPHDVSVNYRMHGDGTYTQHGTAVDADNEPVVDGSGNWDVYADIQVDEDCNPIVNTDGRFLQAEESTLCEIGGKGTTDPFYHHLAFGQYPTSVRDMASIYATIANDGVYNESHFVKKVTNNAGEEVQPKEDSLVLNDQVIDAAVAQNLQWIGSEIGGESATDQLDRDYFGKTGTWEAGGRDKNGEKYPDSYNAHAWYVGAIPQLSIAAWVGNVTSESDPIADPNDDKTNVYGSNTAYPVWYTAMTRILEDKDWEKEEWAGKDESQGNKTSWDIELAGGPLSGGAFCAANGDDPLCASQQEDEAQQECEEGGGTWEGDRCETEEEETDRGQDVTSPTTEPGDDESTGEDEECGGMLQPPCDGDEPTTPEEGATTSQGDDNRNNGN